MRLLSTALLVMAVAVCTHATPLSITPTTTLTAETGNNTSAASNWTTSSNGNLGAANVSKVDHRTLLYPGATTAVYSHLVLWFGPSNHIQVGYHSDDYSQVRKQVDDHVSRGLAGTIIDWYGTSHTVDTTAAFHVMHYAETLQGYPFKFAMMEDKGALLPCANTAGCDVNAQLITDLSYIINTFAGSPAYLKLDGRPVLMFFGLEAYTIDWNYVKARVPGNPVFIFQNAGAFTQTASDGAFAWVQINTTNTYDWKQSYLNFFYSYGRGFPQQHTFGAVYKGFNDTTASWSLNRIMSQQCGQVWLNTWNEIARHHSASNQLEALQIVTWNDYEEGTAIESGIDNCLTLSANVSGSTLSWTVRGNENTLDHYTVFISRDGENLMSLAEVSPGLNSLDLGQFGLGPGNYVLYVKAVGKPSIVNRMSPAVNLTVGEPPTVVLNISPQTGVAPVTVSASASSETAASTVISFGEGTAINASSASHTYTVPGTYTVSATVTDIYGLSGRASQTVTISPNQAPQAVLSISPVSGLAGSTITASTAESSDADDAVASSRIDFGDGTIANGFSASHAYAAGGAYTVTATIADTRGARSVAATTVTISDFSLNISKQNGTITATQPATFLVTVMPRQQMTNSVALSCSGLPAGYRCTFSPASVAPGSAAVTSNLTVSAGTATARARHGALLAFCLPLAGVLSLSSGRRPWRSLRCLGGAGILLLLLVLPSCGGGSQKVSSPPPEPPTPTLTFSVIGTAGLLQRSASASVTIP